MTSVTFNQLLQLFVLRCQKECAKSVSVCLITSATEVISLLFLCWFVCS